MQSASASASMASEAEMVVSEAGAGVGERKRKKTLGRRKIEIKKIASMEARHVCFSKRRDGLYKKATELCALTGAKVTVIVFSPAAKRRDDPEPGGKPYSYGHPSVNAVVDRYLHPDLPGSAVDADALFEAPPPPFMHEYDGLRDRLLEAIAAEARRKDALDTAVRAAGAWTDDVVRNAGMPDLVAMLAALERVQVLKDDAERAIAQQCAAAAAAVGACDACYYDLGDATSFTADDYGGASSGGSHHQQQAAMDAAHMSLLMGGNGVSHHGAHARPPFALAPMLLPPPDHPPQAALVPIAFNYGSDHSHITGYEGHGAAYGTEGCYFGPTAATCNFFG